MIIIEEVYYCLGKALINDIAITITQFTDNERGLYHDWVYYQTMFNNDKILNCMFKEDY